MVEYLLSILNSTQVIALGIKNASNSNIFESILEFASDTSLITRITFIIVFLLGLNFMVFKESLLDCYANKFTLAKETFLILFVRGVYTELEKINVEMESLLDKLNNPEKNIAGKLVDIIYNFEAVYDRYQLLQGQEPPNYSSNSWCYWVFILKMLWVLKLNLLNPIRKISIAFSVAKLNQDLVELKNSDYYHQVTMEEESQQQYQRPPMPPPDYVLVGLHSNKKELIKKLKAENKIQFIVVTGEAGIGKTTLVEKVYLDSEVRSYFELRAFVTVSQTYHPKHILKAIFDQLKADYEPSVSTSQSTTEIVAIIRTYLETSKKSYIIVLDDVSGHDDEFSDCIDKAFPYNEKGSGILMTMRGREPNFVGHWISKLYGITFSVHPLSDFDAKLLFCKKAFHSHNGECPPALTHLLPSIIQKSQNNPLLIGIVAGILAGKQKTMSSWQTVIDDLGIEFRADMSCQRIKNILLYRYNYLS